MRGQYVFTSLNWLISCTKPTAETCVGIIITSRINLSANFLPLKSYTKIPYAVIAEKYTVRIAVDAAIIALFKRPWGKKKVVFFIALIKLVIKCSLGKREKPDCNSALDLVELMISR